MHMVATMPINNSMGEDVFCLFGEMCLNHWWRPVWLIPSQVVVVCVIRLEEEDVEHQVYWEVR